MYTVNGQEFKDFIKAVSAAKEIGAEVYEVATGLRRWAPGTKRTTRPVGILVNADGTQTPFTRVRR